MNLPLHPLWRGHVRAHAFWIDPHLIGEAEAQRRILQHWQPGAVVQRLKGGYLLTLVPPPKEGAPPQGQYLQSQEAPGLVFCYQGQQLMALPPPKDAASGGLLWARGGQLERPEPEHYIQPEQWLDLSKFPCWEGKALGDPPPPPRMVVPEVDLRGRAGVKVDPQLKELLSELATPQKQPQYPPWADGWLGSFLRAWLPKTPQAAPPNTNLPAPPAAPAWQSALAGLLHKAGLYGMVEERQRRYVSELMQSFENGNLDEALKKAIAMSEQAENAQKVPSLPLNLPTPRTELRPSQGGGAGNISLQDEERKKLREYYKNAAQRLEKEGRLDEAVFVLSELLREHLEAVALWERHENYAKAAELAEARRLSPDLLARLYLLAGDEARAVRVARRNGNFADVVGRLERSHPAQGQRLRWLWVEARAQSGALMEAVEIGWLNKELRPKLLPFLEEIWEGPAPFSLWALPFLLHLRADDLEAGTLKIRELLENDTEEAIGLRTHLLTQLRTQSPDRAAGLLRGLWRKYWEEGAVTPPMQDIKDPLLRMTLPPWTVRPTPNTPPLQRVEAYDIGTRAISDACLLRDKQFLVAFGEGGIELRSSQGKLLHHFEVPGSQLVLVDGEEIVLAVANRGQLKLIHRLDIQRRKAVLLGELAIQSFARNCEADRWFVATETEVWAVDLTDITRLLWRLDRIGTLLDLQRGRSSLVILTYTEPNRIERWVYTLPQLVLTVREELPPQTNGTLQSACIIPLGHQAAVLQRLRIEEGPLLVADPPRTAVLVTVPTQFTSVEGFLITQELQANGLHIFLQKLGMGAATGANNKKPLQWETVSALVLQGSQRASFRLQGEYFVICDDRGRLLTRHSATGQLKHSLRL